MDLKAMGRVGLGGGIQGKIGRKLAEPVSEHTRLSVEEVEAVIARHPADHVHPAVRQAAEAHMACRQRHRTRRLSRHGPLATAPLPSDQNSG